MSINPLLGHVKLPGRVFQLPSKGVFYEEGVLAPSVKDGEIQVRPMSALTEIKIRSADLLYSLKIIDEICAECVPEILKPSALVTKDVDALFVFLVASTYGSEKTLRAIHDVTECSEAKWHDYEINIDGIIAEPNNKILDHRDVMFSVKVAENFVVKLRPSTFNDNIDVVTLRTQIAQREANDVQVSVQEVEKLLLKEITSVIAHVEVGEGAGKQVVTDVNFITEWLRTLPKLHMDAILQAAAKSNEWGFSFMQKLKCRDCGKHFEFDAMLNPISFFTG